VSKKRKIAKPNSQLHDGYKPVHVSTYEITTEPILDRRYKRLPKHVKDAIDELHDLSQRQPQKALPELLEWMRYCQILWIGKPLAAVSKEWA